MNTSKPPYPSLQRHRRRSSQPSPTSPSFPRRMLDRPPRIIDPFSPVDSLSATTGASNSPSIDVDVPSPALDIPASSTALYDAQVQNVKRLPVRISEEHSRPKPQVHPSVTRPFTSDAMDTNHGLRTFASNTSGFDTSFRVSPNMTNARLGEYNERRSSESMGRNTENYSPGLRGFAPSPQNLDRSNQEDGGPAKLSATKKSRLNLLNPMSLLARRRSSQNQNDASSLSVTTMHVPALPDNFDPSIRGTITHDFSAPRTRRNLSYGGEGGQFDQYRRDYLSPGMPPRPDQPTPRLQPPSGPTPTHSPMFKEHFQDDRQSLRPAETGYLHNIASQNAAAVSDYSANMPAFARKLPQRLPDQTHPDVPAAPVSMVENSSLDRPLPKEPTEPPPPPPKRSPSPVINLPPASVLPKHMTSTSSRFSFQLGGQASSAQEKLLEEKHKQFQNSKRVSNLSRRDDPEEDNYDDYDFDAEDVFEERIPGVNAADDEDDYDGFRNNIETPAYDPARIEKLNSLQRQSLQGFHFTPQSMTFSPTSTNFASQPTPRDDQGFAIGVADSRDSPEHMQRPEEQNHTATEQEKIAFFDGLGITTSNAKAGPPVAAAHDQKDAFEDADLYFDDGEFADHHYESDPTTFDEDIFDDETMIRDIPAENARRFDAVVQAAGPDGKVKISGSRSSADSAGGYGPSAGATGTGKSAQASSTISGLTEGNLAAYHDALAMAANEAAANGKFRNVSFSQDSEDDASQSQLGLVSDESRLSHNLGYSTIAEDDGFPFDDEMDVDLMIAEANAEALENDDDGFYGQEFGFYARAHGKDNAEMVNGGFFASRGSNGVKRSHSGRANFQEPSLTPITERSEWSTRNSVASLQIPPGIPGSAASLPSPGIAQLLELDSPAHDDEMTLSALMKLRRGAFGGSSTSISSLGAGHAGGSPLGPHGPAHPFSSQDHISHAYTRLTSSLHSMPQSAGIPESEEEDNEAAEEPTLTQNTPMKDPVERPPSTPQEQGTMSPTLGGSGEGRKGHSRTSSGAESVSYARDSDGRWVLERRRTGEDGGMEVEREYLAGVRI